MPEVTHVLTVRAPLATTWDFVKEMSNWAELMPGYQGMRVVDETTSEWKIKGDVGILSKLVTLDVRILEWVERDHVDFVFRCREEQLEARGSLRAAAWDAGATELTFHLTAQAGGMLGPVVNALLAKVLPAMARDFATAIKERIEARQRSMAIS